MTWHMLKDELWICGQNMCITGIIQKQRIIFYGHLTGMRPVKLTTGFLLTFCTKKNTGAIVLLKLVCD